MSKPNLWLVPVLVLLLAAPLLFNSLGQPFYLRVLTRILIFALAASSLNLILGFGGMVSLGHAAFVGLASYIVGIAAYHQANEIPVFTWPFLVEGSTNLLIVAPIAIATSAAFAALIGAISLRTSGLYFIMITLAFAQMLYYTATSLDQYGGDDGMRLRTHPTLPFIDLTDRATIYYVVLAMLLAVTGILSTLTRSRFGLVISGARQNERRIKALGIEPFPYRVACFTISGAIAGCAGVLLTNLDMYVSPTDLSLTRSNELVAMILLGGVGTVWGPPIGAAFYILAQLGLGDLTTHWALIFGPALIIVVLFARRGLLGLLAPKGNPT